MPTLDELTNEEQIKPGIEPGLESGQEVLEVQEPSKVNEMMSRLLTAETGDGPITKYLDHPLNFNQSYGLAQVIRGLSGLISNLNLAVIDIVVGGLRFSKERKGEMDNGLYGRGNLPS